MSTLGTLQHHNHLIEGSLLAKHVEKYVININKFRSTSMVSALLCMLATATCGCTGLHWLYLITCDSTLGSYGYM